MYNKIEYIKNTLEIEGFILNEEEIEFLKEVERNKYTKEEIIQKILEVKNYVVFKD